MRRHALRLDRPWTRTLSGQFVSITGWWLVQFVARGHEMSFFSKLFGKGGDEASEPPSMPWDQRPSIYDHIRSHTNPEQLGLSEGGETLPDEGDGPL